MTPTLVNPLLFHFRGSDAVPCRLDVYDTDAQTKDFQSVPSTQIISRSLDVYPDAQKDAQMLWGAKVTIPSVVLAAVPPSFSETLLHADGVVHFTTRQTFARKPAGGGKKRGMSIDLSGAKQWIGDYGRSLDLCLLPSNSPERLLDTQFLWLREDTGAAKVIVIDLDAKPPFQMMSAIDRNMLADLDTGYINIVKGDPRAAQGAQ